MKLSDIKGLLPEKKEYIENDPPWTDYVSNGFNQAIDLMDKTILEDRLVEIVFNDLKKHGICDDKIVLRVVANTVTNQIISKMPEWITKEK